MRSANAAVDGAGTGYASEAGDPAPALPRLGTLAGTLPGAVAGSAAPGAALVAPGMRYPTVAGARPFPIPGMPAIASAFPEPRAAHPEVSGRGSYSHDLISGWGRLGVGNDIAVARRRRDDARRQGDAHQQARHCNLGANESHRSAFCCPRAGAGTY